jgi:hypothetical protein
MKQRKKQDKAITRDISMLSVAASRAQTHLRQEEEEESGKERCIVALIIPGMPLMPHSVLISGDVSATHLGDSETIANLSDLVKESEEGSDKGKPLTGLRDNNRKPKNTATDDDADNNTDEDLSGPSLANNQIVI